VICERDDDDDDDDDGERRRQNMGGEKRRAFVKTYLCAGSNCAPHQGLALR
jgi:hypothetical protein